MNNVWGLPRYNTLPIYGVNEEESTTLSIFERGKKKHR